jgi:hypothetical protein
VPPKAYAQSRILRRYDEDRLPQKEDEERSIWSCGWRPEAIMLCNILADDSRWQLLQLV